MREGVDGSAPEGVEGGEHEHRVFGTEPENCLVLCHNHENL